MLNRVCFLLRTDTDEMDEAESDTFLSLCIFDAGQQMRCRIAFANSHGIDQVEEWVEKMTHDGTSVLCTLKINGKDFGVVRFDEIYNSVVDSCSIKAKTKSVTDFCKIAIDPLSYSTFLELIHEQSTLPAVLYNIHPVQV